MFSMRIVRAMGAMAAAAVTLMLGAMATYIGYVFYLRNRALKAEERPSPL